MGQVVKLDSQIKASLGIGMVHQHFMLVEHLLLPRYYFRNEITKNGVPDIKKAIKNKRYLKKYGLAVDPSANRDISVGALTCWNLKTLYRGADILIFDEPTWLLLTPAEIDELMIIMKRTLSRGKSIILITHKLSEIRAVSDRVTWVIRRGKNIWNSWDCWCYKPRSCWNDGRTFATLQQKKSPPQPKKLILSIKDLVLMKTSGIQLSRIYHDVRAGRNCWALPVLTEMDKVNWIQAITTVCGKS